jgi:phosphatidylserine/phosphatidylglycerophosphate/cardiolipin synthase-like enzyme
LSKAKEGVVVRVVVWRHELLSYVTRFLYLGEVTIEAEVAKLEKRCKKLGLVIRVIHTSRVSVRAICLLVRGVVKFNRGGLFSQANAASYANPTDSGDANIIIVIAGNPKGIISTHHEKLLLIDPECPKHTVAFTGGFDIARGRFDQSAHLVPLPYRALDLNNIKGVFKGVSEEKRMQAIELAPGLAREQRYSGRTIQALLPPIRFLWHDIQLLIYGPATRLLQLHFAQRWTYAFSQNPNLTKNFTVHMPPMPTTVRHSFSLFVYNHHLCDIGNTGRADVQEASTITVKRRSLALRHPAGENLEKCVRHVRIHLLHSLVVENQNVLT